MVRGLIPAIVECILGKMGKGDKEQSENWIEKYYSFVDFGIKNARIIVKIESDIHRNEA